MYFRTKIVEFAIISLFFLFSGITYLFILLSFSFDLLIFYQLERFFLITSYWFLLILITKIEKPKAKMNLFIKGLGAYSIILLILIALWEKGVQPENAKIFGFEIHHIENVPYHPDGAGLTLNAINLTYGTSFPLLNTVYMLTVSSLLLYTFIKIALPIKTQRTVYAKRLWVISLSFHVVWTIFALPWIDLGRDFQFFNAISAIIIIFIIIYVPEGLILSKSQIMATYYFYDSIAKIEKYEDKNMHFTDLAVEHIIEYIDSMPSEILNKYKDK
ncbi:MAG: hypothetical protein ACW99A_07550 [Candidatus Kariarchaeaceae archaeon]